MLKTCPLPQGRNKQPLTKDERKTISQRMKNVIAERKQLSDYVNNADDAYVAQKLTTARNRVTTLENKLNKTQAKIDAMVGMQPNATKAVKDVRAQLVAEQTSVKKSLQSEQNIRDGIAAIDDAFFKSNPEITPQMVSVYEKTFNLAAKTTDPAMLKSIDVDLKTIERAMEAEVRGITAEVQKIWKTRKVQERALREQVEITRLANNRATRAQKRYINELTKADKQLGRELDQITRQLDGARTTYDAMESAYKQGEQLRRKRQEDLFAYKAARDEHFVKLGEAIQLDPRKGRGVLDWVVSRLGWTLESIGAMKTAAKVRLTLQRAGYLAENAVNKIVDVLETDTLIKFTDDFAKAADELGLTPKQRAQLMTDTIEKGQIPNFLEFFDPNNVVVKEVQRQRYDKYQQSMLAAGFTPQQIDDFVNRAVDVSRVADNTRRAANAFGVTIDTLDPFLGYITRVFNLDGSIFRRRIIDPETVSADILPIGKDGKFQFDISRKYEFLVPTDIDLASDIMQVSKDDLLSMIEDPVQMRLFMDANLTPQQIDTLTTLGFFQKLPMSTTEVYDYLMAQYRLPFANVSDMFELNITENMKAYARAIGDQANISMMLSQILDEEGVKLGWSVPRSLYEADALLPVGQRQFANYVNMQEKMLAWTARLGIPAEVQEQLGNVLMHPVVSDQVIALLDITKSPALLGQMGGAIGWFNNLFNKLKQGTLVANAPVYIANQVRGNFHQIHAAGGNILQWTPAANDLWRVAKGEGVEHLDNTIKRYEIDGKQLTERDLFMWFYDNHGTATTSMFGERGRPSAFKAKDAARNLLSNSSASVWHLMTYMFGTGELTGGKALNSMERVLQGVDYFMQKSGNVLNSLSAPVFYTVNMIDMASKYATLRSVTKRIDGGSAFDKAATYTFSQAAKEFDTTDALNAHLRAYFPDMRDVGSTVYGIGKYAVMFFPWQASMMPRVLRDVIRRPWRYAAYERLRQFTAEPLAEDEDVTEAGISPDILKGLPYFVGRGKDDNTLVFWNDASYNPTTSTFEFIRNITGNETTADRRAKLQGDFRNENLVRLLQSTYAPAKIIYELTSNTNLGTGKALRRTDGRGVPLLGFEVPPELYSIINNAVPYVGALDRLDIEALSGVPEIRDNQGNIIQQGKRGLGGAVPDATGRILRKNEIENNWAYRILGTIGGNLRVVDMVRQNKITYNDVSRSLDIVTKQFDAEQERLLADKRSGSIKNPKTYEERVAALEKLLITRTQLQIDEDRVYLWLRERGELTDKEIKQKERYLIQLQQMGTSPLQSAIEQQAQQLLRFRQEWSIPQYEKEARP